MSLGNRPRCPACHAELYRAPVRWNVLACFSCGGVWADMAATERVANIVDHELIEIARSTAKSCAGATENITPITERACPICTQPMEPIRHARVALEICREHGTWFDRDELGRMARNSDYDRKQHAILDDTHHAAGAIRPPAGSSADIVEDILGD